MKFQESESIELKRTLNKDFTKEVVAFLNTRTGYGVPEVLKHYDKNVFDIEENYINVSIPYDAEVMASMHVTDVGAEHDTENDTENDTEKTIISAIKSNPYVSQEALAKLCNKSRITISRIIKKSNKIKRVGPDKGGHWEIID